MIKITKIHLQLLLDDLLDNMFNKSISRAEYLQTIKQIRDDETTSFYLAQISPTAPLIVIHEQSQALTFYDADMAYNDQQTRVVLSWSQLQPVFETDFNKPHATKARLLDNVAMFIDKLLKDVEIEQFPLIGAFQPYTTETLAEFKANKLTEINDYTITKEVFKSAESQQEKPRVADKTKEWYNPYHRDSYNFVHRTSATNVEAIADELIAVSAKRVGKKWRALHIENRDEIVSIINLLINADNETWVDTIYEQYRQGLYHKYFNASELIYNLYFNRWLPTRKQRKSVNSRLLYARYKLQPIPEKYYHKWISGNT